MEWQFRRWQQSSRGVIGTMLEGEEFCCALCRGKGVLPSAKARCPACGGRGFFRVNLPAMICAYCNGRGEVPARSNITCTVCDGKGLVTVRQPIEVCLQCRGMGAAPNSKLPCLVCRGKGVVTAREDGGGNTRARRDDLGWVAAQANRVMAKEIRAVRGRAERSEVYPQAETSPISIQQVPLPPKEYEESQGEQAGNIQQPQHRRETRTVSPASVTGLVRRLMATERARILGRKTIDLGRYTLEKRTQRWREPRKPFK